MRIALSKISDFRPITSPWFKPKPSFPSRASLVTWATELAPQSRWERTLLQSEFFPSSEAITHTIGIVLYLKLKVERSRWNTTMNQDRRADARSPRAMLIAQKTMSFADKAKEIIRGRLRLSLFGEYYSIQKQSHDARVSCMHAMFQKEERGKRVASWLLNAVEANTARNEPHFESNKLFSKTKTVKAYSTASQQSSAVSSEGCFERSFPSFNVLEKLPNDLAILPSRETKNGEVLALSFQVR